MSINWDAVSAVGTWLGLIRRPFRKGRRSRRRSDTRRRRGSAKRVVFPLVAGPDPVANAMWSRILEREGWPGPDRLNPWRRL